MDVGGVCSGSPEDIGRPLVVVAGTIETVLADVLDHAVRNQIPDGLTAADPGAAVRRGDRHGGHLQQDDVAGALGDAELVAWPRHADEVGQVPDVLGTVPGEDLAEDVRAGDEEQV